MSYTLNIELSEEELSILRDAVSGLGDTNTTAVSLQLKIQNYVNDSIRKTVKDGI